MFVVPIDSMLTTLYVQAQPELCSSTTQNLWVHTHLYRFM